MPTAQEEKNVKLVIDAFNALFNKRDYEFARPSAPSNKRGATAILATPYLSIARRRRAAKREPV